MADDYVLTNPEDHSLNSSWPAEVRNVKKIAIGDGVRFYYEATAPQTRYDGTAFAEQDKGSIWIDSDDNHLYILTATTPTWTDFETIIEAMTLVMASADCTLTLQNTDEENGAGGRQVKFIAKGEQDGSEVTTLGYIEFSHEGAEDDEKGQARVFLNDGNDGNSPTLVMTIPSTGVPPTMVESTAPESDAQLANKKYVDDLMIVPTKVTNVFGQWTNLDSLNNALVKDEVYKVGSDGFVSAVGYNMDIYIITDNENPPTTTTAGLKGTGILLTLGTTSPVMKDQYFKVLGATQILWLPIGSGTCVKQ